MATMLSLLLSHPGGLSELINSKESRLRCRPLHLHSGPSESWPCWTSPAHCPCTCCLGPPSLWSAQPGHVDTFASREPACPPARSPCHGIFSIKQLILLKYSDPLRGSRTLKHSQPRPECSTPAPAGTGRARRVRWRLPCHNQAKQIAEVKEPGNSQAPGPEEGMMVLPGEPQRRGHAAPSVSLLSLWFPDGQHGHSPGADWK